MRSVAVLVGVMFALWLPADLPTGLWIAAAIPVLACLAALPGRVLLILLLAFAYARFVALDTLHERIACDERVLVHAQVTSIPHQVDGGWRFQARVGFPREPSRASVSATVDFRTRSATAPRAAETWQLLLQFSAPRTSHVPGGVDHQRNLLRERIQAEARSIVSPLNRRIAPAAPSWLRLRETLAGKIQRQVADPSSAALLAALAVGVTGDVSLNQWRVFNATGITHLIAISGMHVTFFALLSMAAMRRVWRWFPWVARCTRRENFAAYVGLILAAGYALLSGFSVPAQRTLIMLAAWIISRESARATTPCWTLCVALIAVLMFDPLCVLSAGFWLSFVAVAAIILIPGSRIGRRPSVIAAADVQIAVSIALLPVTVLIFGTFSFVGLFVNIVAIPVFTFLLVPPILLGTLAYLLPGSLAQRLGDVLVSLAAWIADHSWPALAGVADLSFGLWRATPSVEWYALVAVATAFALLPWRPLVRVIALAAMLSAFIYRPASLGEGELWVDVLDVGASTAAIVRTKNHVVLFGTGDVFGSKGRRIEQIVSPFLKRAGNHRLDLLIVGPLSRDRSSAVTAAGALLQPAKVLVASGGKALPPELGECADARRWHWDGVMFDTHSVVDSACALAVTVGASTLQLTLGSRRPKVLAWPISSAQGHVPKLVLASIGQREARARLWRELRHTLEAEGFTVRDTATEGTLQLRLSSAEPGRTHRSSVLGVGVWSRQRELNTCSET
jgi:competence protein ComEC